MRAAPTTNHIAAIHVLKSKLQLSDDDYQALLIHLTGKASSKDMTAAQRSTVRNHMQRLAERVGAVQPTAQRPYAATAATASPKERKVWALWNQLHKDGVIRDRSAQALNAWVHRQVQVDALRFASGPQLDTLIEALKSWQQRKEER